MGFFADLGSAMYAPVKAGSESLMNFMSPDETPYAKGALSGAIDDEEKRKKIMPSATGMLMQQYQPGHNTVLAPQPNVQQLGQMAAAGAPVFTDSSEQAVVSPEAKQDESKFDLQALGQALKSIKKPPSSGKSVSSSGRVGGGGSRFDPRQYQNPLIERELHGPTVQAVRF